MNETPFTEIKPTIVIDGESMVTRETPRSQLGRLELYRPGTITVIHPTKAETERAAVRDDVTPQKWSDGWPALVAAGGLAVPWFTLMWFFPTVMVTVSGLIVMYHVKQRYDALERRTKQIVSIIALIVLSPVLVPLLLLIAMLTGKSPCQCCNCC